MAKSWDRFGYTRMYKARTDTRKTVRTVAALLTAALAKKSRCCTYETPRIRKKAAPIRRKKFLNDVKRVFRALRGCLLCLSDGFLAGDVLRGTTAMYFVRYAQLEMRTNITPMGMRWNRGLMVMVKNLNVKLSVKPENVKK
ncbi:hypothetical protein IBX38_03970 [Candidatus Bathyarchaeota archaeon]|nr:hypothetical protein [Candidatus Bathyarchaeota archaeon]